MRCTTMYNFPIRPSLHPSHLLLKFCLNCYYNFGQEPYTNYQGNISFPWSKCSLLLNHANGSLAPALDLTPKALSSGRPSGRIAGGSCRQERNERAGSEIRRICFQTSRAQLEKKVKGSEEARSRPQMVSMVPQGTVGNVNKLFSDLAL